ncbi:hypothetical protein RNS76_11950, partial [Staphylococcus pseudintermedius]
PGCAGAAPQPGCAVEVRYLITATRVHEPARVFADLAFAFALAAADPRCVGVNFLGPEHHRLAARDYALHMRMIAFFGQHHPAVRVSLHTAGLNPALAPPEDLRSHIRQAVDTAGAQRIGHAAALAYEDDVASLLQTMARRRVAVEIN